MVAKYIKAKGSGCTDVYYYVLDDHYKGKPDKCFFYNYKLDGKLYWQKVGKLSEGITAQFAAQKRSDHLFKIRGGHDDKKKALINEITKSNTTFGEIADAYFNSKSNELKGYVTDKNRYEKHLKPLFEQKPIKDITIFDIDYIKNAMAKTNKTGTIRNVLELLRRLVNYGYKYNLAPKLSFVIELPKADNEVVEYLRKQMKLKDFSQS